MGAFGRGGMSKLLWLAYSAGEEDEAGRKFGAVMADDARPGLRSSTGKVIDAKLRGDVNAAPSIACLYGASPDIMPDSRWSGPAGRGVAAVGMRGEMRSSSRRGVS